MGFRRSLCCHQSSTTTMIAPRPPLRSNTDKNGPCQQGIKPLPPLSFRQNFTSLKLGEMLAQNLNGSSLWFFKQHESDDPRRATMGVLTLPLTIFLIYHGLPFARLLQFSVFWCCARFEVRPRLPLASGCCVLGSSDNKVCWNSSAASNWVCSARAQDGAQEMERN